MMATPRRLRWGIPALRSGCSQAQSRWRFRKNTRKTSCGTWRRCPPPLEGRCGGRCPRWILYCALRMILCRLHIRFLSGDFRAQEYNLCRLLGSYPHPRCRRRIQGIQTVGRIGQKGIGKAEESQACETGYEVPGTADDVAPNLRRIL